MADFRWSMDTSKIELRQSTIDNLLPGQGRCARALWLMGGNFDFFTYLCINPFAK